MRCVVVDDEPLARKGILRYLEQIDFIDVVGVCANVMELKQLLQAEEVDLIFLDISMPYISGIEFLKAQQLKAMVIITTAYQEYALESYQHDVLDYLVKPFPFERFLHAVNKAQHLFKLQEHYRDKQTADSYIFVKSDKQLLKINLDDILYAESMQNYTRIYTKDMKVMTLILLKRFMECLPVDRFVRIHKSYVVAIDKIEAMDGKQLVVNGQSLNIGKAYKEELMKTIENHRIK